jgi:hypothetical protein
MIEAAAAVKRPFGRGRLLERESCAPARVAFGRASR